ncbi:MAG: hypothetical protein M1838_004194 [Thelocarpon superellum]|nr:MAG: hypothetical protein M1838_004194 [Thelocarpon superellum]
MFTVHYIYRSFISPFLNPSMSPIHPFVWIAACCFQVINGLSIGGWLAGYGPTTENDWAGRDVWIAPGIMLWAFGLLGNIWHEDELREIRRAATRTQKRRDEAQQESKGRPKRVDKVYMIPQNGLFGAILYPHYLCEFVEWGGFWMVGGLGCVPARTFLINLLVVMTLRALAGRRWYVARFGREKIGAKKAIFPGLL